MSVEERHLLNKIRFFEDMLLRSKDYRQQENISIMMIGIEEIPDIQPEHGPDTIMMILFWNLVVKPKTFLREWTSLSLHTS